MALDLKDGVAASGDAEKGSGVDELVIAENTEIFVVDAAVERSLVRKLDTKLLPLLTLMYLFNSVCRPLLRRG
jgi:predicted nucleotidyltransferase